MVTVKIDELTGTQEYRIRAQNAIDKLVLLPEISWEWSWEGKTKCGAGNIWRSDIVEKDLGIKMDRKLSVRQQQTAFVVKIPNQNPSLHLGMHEQEHCKLAI